ncbi:MAG: hypothetical protein GY953_41095, partial [bacterium]|nr:hypothetical protein [bacterium]
GGERRAALEWLEKAREARDSWLVFLGIDPVWDGLREDPAFAALIDFSTTSRDRGSTSQA